MTLYVIFLQCRPAILYALGSLVFPVGFSSEAIGGLVRRLSSALVLFSPLLVQFPFLSYHRATTHTINRHNRECHPPSRTSCRRTLGSGLRIFSLSCPCASSSSASSSASRSSAASTSPWIAFTLHCIHKSWRGGGRGVGRSDGGFVSFF